MRCWGANSYGQLGYGNTTWIGDDEPPANAGTVSLGGPVGAISIGNHFTCALLVSGAIRCWGHNNVGQLGLGNTTWIGDTELPSSVGSISLGNTPVVEIATGAQHACVRYDNGSMRCWGYGALGQLGYGNGNNIGDNEVPSSVGVVSVGGNVDELALAYDNTCVRLGTAVKCWGYGGSGTNGYSSLAHLGDNELPSSYGTINLGISVTELSDGGMGGHTCALHDATLRCWGGNTSGQLGYGNTNNIGDNEVPSTAGSVSY